MFWRPKRLAGWNMDYQQIGKQRAKVFGATLHAGLLGNFVADHNHRLVTALRTRIAHILHRLPFGRFANNEDLNIVTAEGGDLLLHT